MLQGCTRLLGLHLFFSCLIVFPNSCFPVLNLFDNNPNFFSQARNAQAVPRAQVMEGFDSATWIHPKSELQCLKFLRFRQVFAEFAGLCWWKTLYVRRSTIEFQTRVSPNLSLWLALVHWSYRTGPPSEHQAARSNFMTLWHCLALLSITLMKWRKCDVHVWLQHV